MYYPSQAITLSRAAWHQEGWPQRTFTTREKGEPLQASPLETCAASAAVVSYQHCSQLTELTTVLPSPCSYSQGLELSLRRPALRDPSLWNEVRLSTSPCTGRALGLSLGFRVGALSHRYQHSVCCPGPRLLDARL